MSAETGKGEGAEVVGEDGKETGKSWEKEVFMEEGEEGV